MHYIGVDVGGTSIKGIVIDESGRILAENKRAFTSGEKLAEDIALVVSALTSAAGGGAEGVGIGCPGMIDGANGTVIFAGNLGLKNSPVAKDVESLTGLKVKITNDANAAALGEANFGAGKNYKNSILVTLGTGVGGGIVIDGKLMEGGKSAGAEIGHMVIKRNGNKCTCGRYGCFETYSSATALIKRTKWAMEEDAGSLMWKSYTSDTATGKTAFDYMDSDPSAKEVVDWYISHLACGLTNLANIFRPEVIMLGGGVSNQRERLTEPLQKLVDAEIFGGTQYAPVKIEIAELGDRAGAIGAAALIMGD